MKLSSKVLAFLALGASGVGAFSIPSSQSQSTTALKAFSYANDIETRDGVNGSRPDIDSSRGGRMTTSRRDGLRGANPAQRVDYRLEKSVWDSLRPVMVQGGSLKTWSFQTPVIQRVQVLMKTEGRPLNANVDLWQGPDNTPQKMGIYIEDGAKRPFSAIIETPRDQNAIAIRNTGQMEFPLSACVEADVPDVSGNGLRDVVLALEDMSMPEIIQGGALKTYSFAPSVASVQILLKTDGRPLNARIELLQGPNNNKQVVELYIEDGMERPFFMVIETPGTGNVVRIVNTAPVEFPLNARVEPYLIEPENTSNFIVSDGEGGGWGVRPY